MSRAVAATVGALLLAACAARHPGIEVAMPPGPTPWTALDVADGGDAFRFVVVTDRTGRHRAGVFAAAMAKIDLLRPAFVVSVGDLIEGYTEDEAVLDAQWDEIEALVARLDAPFFFTPGNHDYSNPVMAQVWAERFGPSYYAFRYEGVLFLVLNSELFAVAGRGAPVAGPAAQRAQMAFIADTLAAHHDAPWTIVLLHQPLWDALEVPADWLEVETLLGKRPYTVFAGHLHAYTKHVRHDRRYITLATTGGASAMRGTAFGELDHVAAVTMTDTGPVIANLALDGIHDEDLRTAADRAALDALAEAVSAAPMPVAGPTFTGGTARVTVRNPIAVPVKVVGRPLPMKGRTIAPPRFAAEIPPGDEHAVEVAISEDAAVPLAEVAPAFVDWRLTAALPGHEPAHVYGATVLLPEDHLPCPPPAGTVRVDGRLDEWPPLRFAIAVPAEQRGPAPVAGPDDLQVRFDVRCAADAVYVAVDVRDEAVLVSPARGALAQDRINVSVDPRPAPARDRDVPIAQAFADGLLRELLFVSLGPVEPVRDEATARLLAPAPEGMRDASQRHAAGYAAELRVPGAYLAARQGGEWSGFRLNLSVRDFDPEQRGFSEIWWRPDRFGPAAVPGAGTFVREP